MGNGFEGRIRRLEAARQAAPSFVVHVEDGANEAAAVAGHQRKAGYIGPVVLAPAECATAAE